MNDVEKATIRILGSGTSTGVPIIGCRCPVCTSADPRDRRLRFGLHISARGYGLEIDVSPDFREQALANAIERVDAVVVSHCHADHVLGMDDLRRYNTLQQGSIDVWGRPPVLKDTARIFGYIFDPPREVEEWHLYRPKLVPRALPEFPEATPLGPFSVRIAPVPHGPAEASAIEVSFEGRRLVVASDCSAVTPTLAEMLHGADVAIIDGLRDRPHTAHLTMAAATEALEKAHCRRGFIIHIGHEISHAALEARLPAGISPAYDGEVIEL